ncbi:MAG: organic solvent tolerance protein [Bdellovibrionales bacterium RIFCSPHIGHO2_01_FULL_40_29]|nr:MAG: organic solvent tolerance protein [Bdellovibrionales bacterium RIFCSPHIGHO2_01_FULL_40_29]OFZ35589.1 MAG: organic solvent tolerance protein [Bdellovibrionales bacterium RIFCSPHIGHO2_02_FULL_40_15]
MRVQVSIFLTLVLILFAQTIFAKDMTHRFGLGVKNNTSENLPSLTSVYFFSQDLAFTGGVGLDTKKNESKFQMNVGVRKMVFTEPNLNFYTGAQAGIANYEDPVLGKQSGFEMLAVFGTEFFFTGLENLGLTFEGGFGVTSLKDVRFRTIADDPFRAGLIFYF